MTITKRDNACFNSAGLAIATTTQQVKTANALGYSVNGRTYNKAITDNLWTLSGTSLAAREVCVFFLLLDASGTASIQQSAIKPSSASTSTTRRYVAGAFDWPEPADKAVVGAVLVNSGASTFVPGTTALTSVATYINAGPDYGTPIAY